MANDKLGFPHPDGRSGLTLYAIIRNMDGQAYDTTNGFEAYATATIADYDIALTEQGTASAYYQLTFPALARGQYHVSVYERIGASPAEGDPIVAEGLVDWAGIALGTSLANGEHGGSEAVLTLDRVVLDSDVSSALIISTSVSGVPAIAIYESDNGAVHTFGNAIVYGELLVSSHFVVGGDTTFVGPVTATDLSNDIRVNTVEVSGTTQTARDLGASVLLSNGTGTGQVKLSSGYVSPNWGDIGSPTTSVNLSNTTVNTATNVGTVNGLAANVITTASIADGALTAAKAASGFFDAVWSVSARSLTTFGSLVADIWAYATRVLTAGTNIVLAKGTGVTGFNDLDAAGVRSAVGLSSNNLDTQLGDIPTNAELNARTLVAANYATSAAQTTAQNDLDILTGTDGVTLATSQPNYEPATATALASLVTTVGVAGAGLTAADDAVIAAIAALNNLSSAQVQTAAAAALTAYDPPTNTEFEARSLPSADYFVVADYTVPPTVAQIDTQLSSTHGATAWTTATGFAVAGDAMTLTSAYDAAKTAASQASVDDLPTNAELATSQAAADDATLAAIAALNNLSSAQVQTAAAAALTAYDPPTNAEMEARTLLAAAYGTAANQTTIIGYVDDIGVAGAGLTALASQASVNALNNLSSAQAQSAVTAALNAALTEAYRAAGATGSVAQLLYEISAHLGRAAINSTTKTLSKIDGTTTAQTYTLDDANTPTAIEHTT